MTVAGIVAEYNPFHTGHAYQIAQTRQRLGDETAVVAVMSGNWVQQADCAIADKWVRTQLALTGGVDLVLELPTMWAMSSAESFARGAVSLLAASGMADVLSFGSECGEVAPLEALAACLDAEPYRADLSHFLDQGLSFAAARQAAVRVRLGYKAELLSMPNNNLGVEYIRAINALNSTLRPMTVLRRGAAHNSVEAVACKNQDGRGQGSFDSPKFVSATQLRLDLSEQRWDQAEPYLGKWGRVLLEGRVAGLPALERVERAMLARLRGMTAEDWTKLPDSGAGEGLPQRLERAGRQCVSMKDFFALAKTKRYSHARLRRLALWAYLGVTAAEIPAYPPYLRVLGFNERGRAVLKERKARSVLPILTKPAHARELDEPGRRLFELEARYTDLYDLCFQTVRTPGQEWTTGPVILDSGSGNATECSEAGGRDGDQGETKSV